MNDEKNSKKPEQVLAKIAENKLGKFYEENCLLYQAFAKDPSVTVRKIVGALFYAFAHDEFGKSYQFELGRRLFGYLSDKLLDRNRRVFRERHMGGKMGTLVELKVEGRTDANTAELVALAHDVAMHVAAFQPPYVPCSRKYARTPRPRRLF